jgi:hypothetical protein
MRLPAAAIERIEPHLGIIHLASFTFGHLGISPFFVPPVARPGSSRTAAGRPGVFEGGQNLVGSNVIAGLHEIRTRPHGRNLRHLLKFMTQTAGGV